MKIVLINPPAEHEIMGNNPQIIESERGYNPPLGILYIASYLEKYSGFEVEVIDAQVEELGYEEIESRLRAMKPDLAGITAMSFTMVDVIKTLETVKKANPDTVTVAGGPHVYIYPEETISLPSVDFLVIGEGERTFKVLAETLAGGGDLEQVPSIVFKDGSDEIKKTAPAPLIENLDELPHPARHLTPYGRYSSILFSRTPVTTVFTSRGCPFVCSFCLRPHLGKKFRARSPENVIEEMEICMNMGIRDFLIYDDTFTVDKNRVMKICDLILEKKMNIRWDCRSRVDTIDEEMLKKMKKAGCLGIHYGIEAGTARVLKNLRKNISLEKAERICRLTREAGIKTLNYFMIGSPGETREDIEQTFKIMKKFKADYVHLTVFTPFPGTELYAKGLREGILKKDCWKEFARNPDEGFVPPHWPENFTLEEMRNLLIEGYKRFYLRPGYLIKKVLEIESAGELWRKARAGLKVLFMRG